MVIIIYYAIRLTFSSYVGTSLRGISSLPSFTIESMNYREVYCLKVNQTSALLFVVFIYICICTLQFMKYVLYMCIMLCQTSFRSVSLSFQLKYNIVLAPQRMTTHNKNNRRSEYV